ncbi:MAG: hypothetical protein ABIT05_02250 [Chitinophagaceae bacterium]
MRHILSFLPGLFLLFSCNNSGTKTGETKMDSSVTTSTRDTTGDAALVENSEKMKASVEAMAPSLIKQELLLKDAKASESVKQEWMKMDIYKDGSGAIRRIKLYPHQGVSERSEEYYFNNEKLFFVYISDHGVATEDRDEGKPGKEFHFQDNRLIKYDDQSGDKELDVEQERKMYETSLQVKANEYLEIARSH